jgi:hypothetical protein
MLIVSHHGPIQFTFARLPADSGQGQDLRPPKKKRFARPGECSYTCGVNTLPPDEPPIRKDLLIWAVITSIEMAVNLSYRDILVVCYH